MRGWRPLALTTRWHGSTLRPSFVDTLWGGVGARKPCNFFENGDKIGISGILCFSRNGVFYYIIGLKSVFLRRRFPLKSVENYQLFPGKNALKYELFVPFHGTILRLGNISELPLLSLLRMVGKNATNRHLSIEGQANVWISNSVLISRLETSS